MGLGGVVAAESTSEQDRVSIDPPRQTGALPTEIPSKNICNGGRVREAGNVGGKAFLMLAEKYIPSRSLVVSVFVGSRQSQGKKLRGGSHQLLCNR